MPRWPRAMLPLAVPKGRQPSGFQVVFEDSPDGKPVIQRCSTLRLGTARPRCHCHAPSPRHAPHHATPLLTTPRPCGTVTTPVTQVAHTPTPPGTGARSRARPPTTAPSSTCARSCGGTTWASSSRCAAALLTAWDALPSRPRPSGRLRCGHARRPRPPILRGSTPRRDDGYEEHGEAGADFAMIGHLHEQRKQLLATIEQSESELGSVVLQLSSLESGGGLF